MLIKPLKLSSLVRATGGGGKVEVGDGWIEGVEGLASRRTRMTELSDPQLSSMENTHTHTHRGLCMIL